MDRTNTPPSLWFLCHRYLADVHNVCANPRNKWKVPNQVSGGDTQDISHLLQFSWMQPVLYLDPTTSFPNSNEKPGYFVGFDMTSGDALTFKILTKDMKEVLTRSVVRPADDMKSRNRRVKFNDDVENKFEKMDPNTKKYIHRKHLNTPSDTKQNNDSEKDEEGIATRTRSRSHTEQAVSMFKYRNRG